MAKAAAATLITNSWKLSSANQTLVSAPDIEIENADRLTKPFWLYLNRYLHEQCQIVPGTNNCATLYFDTSKFDVFRSGISLRDRPGGLSSYGESFKDEFSAKCQHPEFTEYARQLTQSLYQCQRVMGFMPYVRREIESHHTHPRDVSEYRYFDFSPEIQVVLEDRMGSRCKDMVYKPQVVTYVERHRYSVFLDPENAYNFILPASFKPDEQIHQATHVCVEVAMDKCVHRRPDLGLPINETLSVSPADAGRFTFLKADWLKECEFKAKLSGAALTDEKMVAAYTRFRMFFYDLSVPFRKENREEPILPVRSKAARGLEALFGKYPKLAPPDAGKLLEVVP